MRPPLRFAVGDTVEWSSVNRRRPNRYTVTKVGRKLVYISGDNLPYRIDDGSRNDGNWHERIRSLDVAAWDKSRDDATAYFMEHGLRQDYSRVDGEWLIWAAGVLQGMQVPRLAAAPLAAEGKEKEDAH